MARLPKFDIEPVLLYCVFIFGVAAVVHGLAGDTSELRRLLAGVVGFHVPLLVALPFLLHHQGVGLGDGLGLNRRPGRAILWGLAFAVVFLPTAFVMMEIIARLMALGRVPVESQKLVETIAAAPSLRDQMIYGFLAVVAAPVVEEVLFRGVLYPTLKPCLRAVRWVGAGHWLRRVVCGGLWHLRRQRWAAVVHRTVVRPLVRTGVPLGAALGVSLFFGLSHGHFPTFLPLVVLSLGLIWLYESTGNLLAPILAHAAFNLVNFLLIL